MENLININDVMEQFGEPNLVVSNQQTDNSVVWDSGAEQRYWKDVPEKLWRNTTL